MSVDLARRFEAVVFDWDRTLGSEQMSDAVRLRRLVEEASGLGLELLALSRGSEVFSPGHDGSHPLLDGTAPTGKDCGHWIMRTLWERGIMPDQMVSVGPEPAEGLAEAAWVVGGSEALAALFEDQIARRRRGVTLVQDSRARIGRAPEVPARHHVGEGVVIDPLVVLVRADHARPTCCSAMSARKPPRSSSRRTR
jgi:hypothetical protein